jgi:DNA-binding MltR family transcriptional regulator
LEKILDKKEQITTILDYLNQRLSVMNEAETNKVKKILEDDDITLKEVVEWYIDYVWSHS